MSVDRLKPAFGFADPVPSISIPKGGWDHRQEDDAEDSQEVPEPGRGGVRSGRGARRVLIDRDQVEIRPCQPAPRQTGKLNRQFF